MNTPLRIGILINNYFTLPAWEYEMLAQLKTSDFASIIAFVGVENTNQAGFKEPFVYKLFKQFENWWFKSEWDACIVKDVKGAFTNASYLSIGNGHFNENEVRLLKELELDVIYRANGVVIPQALHSFSKFGIWQIVFGTGCYRNALPEAFWEVMKNENVTCSSLEIMMHSDSDPLVIYAGVTTTVPYSVKNNFNSIAWKSSSYFSFRMRELFLLGSDIFFKKYNNTITSKLSQALLPPGNTLMTALFVRNIFGYMRYKIKAIFGKKKAFSILYSHKSFSISDFTIKGFKKLKSEGKGFYADPFIIEYNDTHFLFFENFSFKKNKAHISVTEIGAGGILQKPVTVLEKPYHLSYPFVFKFWDNYYMLPETGDNNSVDLYRAIDFPWKWELEVQLMNNIALIDPTLVYYNTKWWLFGNRKLHPFVSSNDQLFLYYSENLLSNEWIAHPQNPIITDIGNCRPAGRIFEKNGKLYRPAQNNAAKQYGYGLNINEIELLTEIEYKEKRVFQVVPGELNKLSGIHSIDFTNQITVIDAILK